MKPVGTAGRRLLVEILKCHGIFFFFNSHWHNVMESCSWMGLIAPFRRNEWDGGVL